MTADTRNRDIESVLGEMWRETCERGNELDFRIVSGSMSPLIRVGDIVRVAWIDPGQLRIGDIIAFGDGNNIIVHRITGISRYGEELAFRQRGDYNGATGEIMASALIGRIIMVKRGTREIFLENPSWFRRCDKLIVFRLRLLERLGRLKPRWLGALLQVSLRPLWRLYRLVHFWRLRGSGNDDRN